MKCRLLLKIACLKKENNSVQYSSPVVQSSEWIHPQVFNYEQEIGNRSDP